MADDVQLNRVSGTPGDTIAADEIGGIKHQRVKVQHGVDGSASDASDATPVPVKDFLIDITRGAVTGYSGVHKFGRNTAVGTSFVPIALGGVYQTPQPAAATTLRIKAGGHANDNSSGAGAREVTLIGLDASGDEVTETVATNGATASTATTASFIRLYRAYVSGSGTYATTSTGSHADDIVIENSGGGTDWLTIDATDYAKGQSEVAFYSVPSGKKGYIQSFSIFTDSARTTDIMVCQRTGILQTAPPYDGWRLLLTESLKSESSFRHPSTPIGPIVGPADVGFMAKVETATGAVEIDFELIVVDN